MQLSKTTIEILSNFATINPSAVLKQGKFINTKSVNNVIYAEANIPDEIESELRIYSLSSFIGVTSMIGLPSVINEDGEYITITNADSKSKAEIRMGDVGTIIHPKKSITFPVAEVVFELSIDHLKQIKKSASTMNLTLLSFVNVNGKIVARLSGAEGNQNKFEIEICDYAGTAEFEFILLLSNLKMIDGDYKILISKNGVVKFEGSVISYVIALDAKSTYSETEL